MVKVIGVRFENAGKLYFFDPGDMWPTPGDFVVVETSRGIEFGEVVTQIQEIDDSRLSSPLKPVVRIASEEDVAHAKENKAAEKEAHAICQKKIAEHKLDMKLVSVEYTFDNSKILFYFTANGRVDFRSLVKDLAGVFKTRIELRQIGVRDEAKMIGGLGPCGRQICCGAFLGDFQPVSIKMAKEQNLSLNPNKISGICGRLMCCLKYEQDQYEQIRKKMPKVGKEVITPDGNGIVWDLNVIKETVRVKIQKGDSSELKDYPMDEVQRVGQVQHQSAAAADKPVADGHEASERSKNERKAKEKSEEPTNEKKERRPLKKTEFRKNAQTEEHVKSENKHSEQNDKDEKREAAQQVVKEAPRADAAKPTAEALPEANDWKAALARAMAAADEADND